MCLIHWRFGRVLLSAMSVFAVALPAGAQSFTVGADFTGTTRSQSGFIPPDTMGAVGPNHVAELINGRFAVYDRAGVQSVGISLNSFWSNAGVSHDGSFAFDPRLLYDPFSQRWFACSVDNAAGPNNFLVAVSSSSDPTASWSGFKIDSDGADVRWADFPTLGLNGDALVISANMFPISSGSMRVSMLVVPKADLLAVTPTVANHTLIGNLTTFGVGTSVHPAVDMDNGSLPLPMLSAFNKVVGQLKRTDMNGPATAPSTGSPTPISVTTRSAPPDAEQPGPKKNLETNDSRFSSSVVIQDGSLWAAHPVNVDGRAAIEWYQIRQSDNVVLQSGLIADDDLAFYYPSISVNDYGDVVIGFSGSSESQYVSTYAAVGDTLSGVTTFSAPTLLHAGVSDYERLDTINRNRWGDYSATVADPTNPFRFWTFQEYVHATNEWATRITELVVPNRADFDGDFDADADDVDILCANVGGGSALYDLDGDADVDADDLTVMIETLIELVDGRLGTAVGDFNLDGLVNATDLATMNVGFGLTGLGYADGNANCDTFIDATDLAILAANFGYIALSGGSVPEPASLTLLSLVAIGFLRRRRE